MRKHTLFLCMVMISSYLFGQEFPKGVWTIITDDAGNVISTKNAARGARSVSSFDFQDSKYSFSLEEYDSTGRLTLLVEEHGAYSFTSSQFTLAPNKSSTSYYEYTAQAAKPITSSVRKNPLANATYNWVYQKELNRQLTIEALRPGYREGFISGGTKARKPLPPAVQRSFARSM